MKNLKIVTILLITFLVSCKGNKSETTSVNYDNFKTINSDFVLHSEAVENGVLLDAYKCEPKVDGIENSIPLSWENVPKNTKSLAIIMYHYPKKDDSTEINSYLLLWDINPDINEIPYKAANKGSWYMGGNKDGKSISYTSPCSRGPGKHKYTIAIYALSETPATLPKNSSVDVDYNVLMNAISTVDIIDRTALSFTVSQ